VNGYPSPDVANPQAGDPILPPEFTHEVRIINPDDASNRNPGSAGLSITTRTKNPDGSFSESTTGGWFTPLGGLGDQQGPVRGSGGQGRSGAVINNDANAFDLIDGNGRRVARLRFFTDITGALKAELAVLNPDTGDIITQYPPVDATSMSLDRQNLAAIIQASTGQPAPAPDADAARDADADNAGPTENIPLLDILKESGSYDPTTRPGIERILREADRDLAPVDALSWAAENPNADVARAQVSNLAAWASSRPEDLPATVREGELLGRGGYGSEVNTVEGRPDLASKKVGLGPDEAEALLRLEAAGIPTVYLGKARTESGAPTLLLRRMPGPNSNQVIADPSIAAQSGPLPDDVRPQLENVFRKLHEAKLDVADPSWFIDDEGKVVLADPLLVYPDTEPGDHVLDMMDTYLRAYGQSMTASDSPTSATSPQDPTDTPPQTTGGGGGDGSASGAAPGGTPWLDAASVGVPSGPLPGLSELTQAIHTELARQGVPESQWPTPEELDGFLRASFRDLVTPDGAILRRGVELPEFRLRLQLSDGVEATDLPERPVQQILGQFQITGNRLTSTRARTTGLSVRLPILDAIMHVLAPGLSFLSGLSGGPSASSGRGWATAGGGAAWSQGGGVIDNRGPSISVRFQTGWKVWVRQPGYDAVPEWAAEVAATGAGESAWRPLPDLPAPAARLLVTLPQALAAPPPASTVVVDPAAQAPSLPDHTAVGMTGRDALGDQVLALLPASLRTPLTIQQVRVGMQALAAWLGEVVDGRDGFLLPIFLEDGHVGAIVGVTGELVRDQSTGALVASPVGVASDRVHAERLRIEFESASGSVMRTVSSGGGGYAKLRLGALLGMGGGPGAGGSAELNRVAERGTSVARNSIRPQVRRDAGETQGFLVQLRLVPRVHVFSPTSGVYEAQGPGVDSRVLLHMPRNEGYGFGLPVAADARVTAGLDRVPSGYATAWPGWIGPSGAGPSTVRNFRAAQELFERVYPTLAAEGLVPPRVDGKLMWSDDPATRDTQVRNLRELTDQLSSRGLEGRYDQAVQSGIWFWLLRPGAGPQPDAVLFRLALKQDISGASLLGVTSNHRIVNLDIGSGSFGRTHSVERTWSGGVTSDVQVPGLPASTGGAHLGGSRGVSTRSGWSVGNTVNDVQLFETTGPVAVFDVPHKLVLDRADTGTDFQAFGSAVGGAEILLPADLLDPDLRTTGPRAPEPTSPSTLDHAFVMHLDTTGLLGAALDVLPPLTSAATRVVTAVTAEETAAAHVAELLNGGYGTDFVVQGRPGAATRSTVWMTASAGPSRYLGLVNGAVTGKINLTLGAVGATTGAGTVRSVATSAALGGAPDSAATLRGGDAEGSVSVHIGGREQLDIRTGKLYLYGTELVYTVRGDRGTASVGGRTLVYAFPESVALAAHTAGELPVSTAHVGDALRRWVNGDLSLDTPLARRLEAMHHADLEPQLVEDVRRAVSARTASPPDRRLPGHLKESIGNAPIDRVRLTDASGKPVQLLDAVRSAVETVVPGVAQRLPGFREMLSSQLGRRRWYAGGHPETMLDAQGFTLRFDVPAGPWWGPWFTDHHVVINVRMELGAERWIGSDRRSGVEEQDYDFSETTRTGSTEQAEDRSVSDSLASPDASGVGGEGELVRGTSFAGTTAVAQQTTRVRHVGDFTGVDEFGQLVKVIVEARSMTRPVNVIGRGLQLLGVGSGFPSSAGDLLVGDLVRRVPSAVVLSGPVQPLPPHLPDSHPLGPLPESLAVLSSKADGLLDAILAVLAQPYLLGQAILEPGAAQPLEKALEALMRNPKFPALATPQGRIVVGALPVGDGQSDVVDVHVRAVLSGLRVMQAGIEGQRFGDVNRLQQTLTPSGTFGALLPGSLGTSGTFGVPLFGEGQSVTPGLTTTQRGSETVEPTFGVRDEATVKRTGRMNIVDVRVRYDVAAVRRSRTAAGNQVVHTVELPDAATGHAVLQLFASDLPGLLQPPGLAPNAPGSGPFTQPGPTPTVDTSGPDQATTSAGSQRPSGAETFLWNPATRIGRGSAVSDAGDDPREILDTFLTRAAFSATRTTRGRDVDPEALADAFAAGLVDALVSAGWRDSPSRVELKIEAWQAGLGGHLDQVPEQAVEDSPAVQAVRRRLVSLGHRVDDHVEVSRQGHPVNEFTYGQITVGFRVEKAQPSPVPAQSGAGVDEPAQDADATPSPAVRETPSDVVDLGLPGSPLAADGLPRQSAQGSILDRLAPDWTTGSSGEGSLGSQDGGILPARLETPAAFRAAAQYYIDRAAASGAPEDVLKAARGAVVQRFRNDEIARRLGIDPDLVEAGQELTREEEQRLAAAQAEDAAEQFRAAGLDVRVETVKSSPVVLIEDAPGSLMALARRAAPLFPRLGAAAPIVAYDPLHELRGFAPHNEPLVREGSPPRSLIVLGDRVLLLGILGQDAAVGHEVGHAWMGAVARAGVKHPELARVHIEGKPVRRDSYNAVHAHEPRRRAYSALAGAPEGRFDYGRTAHELATMIQAATRGAVARLTAPRITLNRWAPYRYTVTDTAGTPTAWLEFHPDRDTGQFSAVVTYRPTNGAPRAGGVVGSWPDLSGPEDRLVHVVVPLGILSAPKIENPRGLLSDTVEGLQATATAMDRRLRQAQAIMDNSPGLANMVRRAWFRLTRTMIDVDFGGDVGVQHVPAAVSVRPAGQAPEEPATEHRSPDSVGRSDEPRGSRTTPEGAGETSSAGSRRPAAAGTSTWNPVTGIGRGSAVSDDQDIARESLDTLFGPGFFFATRRPTLGRDVDPDALADAFAAAWVDARDTAGWPDGPVAASLEIGAWQAGLGGQLDKLPDQAVAESPAVQAVLGRLESLGHRVGDHIEVSHRGRPVTEYAYGPINVGFWVEKAPVSVPQPRNEFGAAEHEFDAAVRRAARGAVMVEITLETIDKSLGQVSPEAPLLDDVRKGFRQLVAGQRVSVQVRSGPDADSVTTQQFREKVGNAVYRLRSALARGSEQGLEPTPEQIPFARGDHRAIAEHRMWRFVTGEAPVASEPGLGLIYVRSDIPHDLLTPEGRIDDLLVRVLAGRAAQLKASGAAGRTLEFRRLWADLAQRAYLRAMPDELVPPDRRALRDATDEQITAAIRTDPDIADQFVGTDPFLPWADPVAEEQRILDWIHEVTAEKGWTGPDTRPDIGSGATPSSPPRVVPGTGPGSDAESLATALPEPLRDVPPLSRFAKDFGFEGLLVSPWDELPRSTAEEIATGLRARAVGVAVRNVPSAPDRATVEIDVDDEGTIAALRPLSEAVVSDMADRLRHAGYEVDTLTGSDRLAELQYRHGSPVDPYHERVRGRFANLGQQAPWRRFGLKAALDGSHAFLDSGQNVVHKSALAVLEEAAGNNAFDVHEYKHAWHVALARSGRVASETGYVRFFGEASPGGPYGDWLWMEEPYATLRTALRQGSPDLLESARDLAGRVEDAVDDAVDLLTRTDVERDVIGDGEIVKVPDGIEIGSVEYVFDERFGTYAARVFLLDGLRNGLDARLVTKPMPEGRPDRDLLVQRLQETGDRMRFRRDQIRQLLERTQPSVGQPQTPPSLVATGTEPRLAQLDEVAYTSWGAPITHGWELEGTASDSDTDALTLYRLPDIDDETWLSLSPADQFEIVRERGTLEGMVRTSLAPDYMASVLGREDGPLTWETKSDVLRTLRQLIDQVRDAERLLGSDLFHIHTAFALPSDLPLRGEVEEVLPVVAAYWSDHATLGQWALWGGNAERLQSRLPAASSRYTGPWSAEDVATAATSYTKNFSVGLRAGDDPYADPDLRGFETRVVTEEGILATTARIQQDLQVLSPGDVDRYTWPDRPGRVSLQQLQADDPSLVAFLRQAAGDDGRTLSRLAMPLARWESHPAMAAATPEELWWIAEWRDQYRSSVHELMDQGLVGTAALQSLEHALTLWADGVGLHRMGAWSWPVDLGSQETPVTSSAASAAATASAVAATTSAVAATASADAARTAHDLLTEPDAAIEQAADDDPLVYEVRRGGITVAQVRYTGRNDGDGGSVAQVRLFSGAGAEVDAEPLTVLVPMLDGSPDHGALVEQLAALTGEAAAGSADLTAGRDEVPAVDAGADTGSAAATVRERLTVVANRLPVAATEQPDGTVVWQTSPGGLVSALVPVLRRGGRWVGWTGKAGEAPAPWVHEGFEIVPVPLSEEEISKYYLGAANGALWPNYHINVYRPDFNQDNFDVYRAVNERFAQDVPGGLRWFQDYQLQLAPGFRRQLQPGERIGWFNHIPFPPFEVFTQLPWHEEILRGLLGADLLGFQTAPDAANFLASAARLGFTVENGAVRVPGAHGERIVRVGDFPISIDAAQQAEIASRPEVVAAARRIRRELGDPETLLLAVDRLDPTKGIDQRLRAIEELFKTRQLDPAKTVFVQIAVPSREQVPAYQTLRRDVDELVGRINSDYGRLGRFPVVYLYRSFPMNELAAFYLAADVALVTPWMDGMNLVAKEFVASRTDNTGALVLSRFAGAARELGQGAFLINPHDLDGFQRTILQALRTPPAERMARMAGMRQQVQDNDVAAWAQRYLDALRDPWGTPPATGTPPAPTSGGPTPTPSPGGSTATPNAAGASSSSAQRLLTAVENALRPSSLEGWQLRESQRAGSPGHSLDPLRERAGRGTTMTTQILGSPQGAADLTIVTRIFDGPAGEQAVVSAADLTGLPEETYLPGFGEVSSTVYWRLLRPLGRYDHALKALDKRLSLLEHGAGFVVPGDERAASLLAVARAEAGVRAQSPAAADEDLFFSAVPNLPVVRDVWQLKELLEHHGFHVAALEPVERRPAADVFSAEVLADLGLTWESLQTEGITPTTRVPVRIPPLSIYTTYLVPEIASRARSYVTPAPGTVTPVPPRPTPEPLLTSKLGAGVGPAEAERPAMPWQQRQYIPGWRGGRVRRPPRPSGPPVQLTAPPLDNAGTDPSLPDDAISRYVRPQGWGVDDLADVVHPQGRAELERWVTPATLEQVTALHEASRGRALLGGTLRVDENGQVAIVGAVTVTSRDGRAVHAYHAGLQGIMSVLRNILRARGDALSEPNTVAEGSALAGAGEPDEASTSAPASTTPAAFLDGVLNRILDARRPAEPEDWRAALTQPVTPSSRPDLLSSTARVDVPEGPVRPRITRLDPGPATKAEVDRSASPGTGEPHEASTSAPASGPSSTPETDEPVPAQGNFWDESGEPAQDADATSPTAQAVKAVAEQRSKNEEIASAQGIDVTRLYPVHREGLTTEQAEQAGAALTSSGLQFEKVPRPGSDSPRWDLIVPLSDATPMGRANRQVLLPQVAAMAEDAARSFEQVGMRTRVVWAPGPADAPGEWPAVAIDAAPPGNRLRRVLDAARPLFDGLARPLPTLVYVPLLPEVVRFNGWSGNGVIALGGNALRRALLRRVRTVDHELRHIWQQARDDAGQPTAESGKVIFLGPPVRDDAYGREVDFTEPKSQIESALEGDVGALSAELGRDLAELIAKHLREAVAALSSPHAEVIKLDPGTYSIFDPSKDQNVSVEVTYHQHQDPTSKRRWADVRMERASTDSGVIGAIVRRGLPEGTPEGNLGRLAELLEESAQAIDRRHSHAQTLYDNADEWFKIAREFFGRGRAFTAPDTTTPGDTTRGENNDTRQTGIRPGSPTSGRPRPSATSTWNAQTLRGRGSAVSDNEAEPLERLGTFFSPTFFFAKRQPAPGRDVDPDALADAFAAAWVDAQDWIGYRNLPTLVELEIEAEQVGLDEGLDKPPDQVVAESPAVRAVLGRLEGLGYRLSDRPSDQVHASQRGRPVTERTHGPISVAFRVEQAQLSALPPPSESGAAEPEFEAAVWRTARRAVMVEVTLQTIDAGIGQVRPDDTQQAQLVDDLRAAFRQLVAGQQVAVYVQSAPDADDVTRQQFQQAVENVARAATPADRPFREDDLAQAAGQRRRAFEARGRPVASEPTLGLIYVLADVVPLELTREGRIDDLLVHELALRAAYLKAPDQAPELSELQARLAQRAYLRAMSQAQVPPARRTLRNATDEHVLAAVRAEPLFAGRFAGTDPGRPWAELAAEEQQVVGWIHELTAQRGWAGASSDPTLPAGDRLPRSRPGWQDLGGLGSLISAPFGPSVGSEPRDGIEASTLYLDDLLTPDEFLDSLAAEHVAQALIDALGRLTEADRRTVAESTVLLDLGRSQNPRVVEQLENLMRNPAAQARWRGLAGHFRLLAETAAQTADLPLFTGPLTEVTSIGGGLGAFYAGELNGQPVLFKTGRALPTSAHGEQELLQGLEPYGGPRFLGRYAIRPSTDGIERDAVAMQAFGGADVLSLLRLMDAGDPLPFQVTQAHADALGALRQRLADDDVSFNDVHPDQLVLTQDPDRLVVPVGVRVHASNGLPLSGLGWMLEAVGDLAAYSSSSTTHPRDGADSRRAVKSALPEPVRGLMTISEAARRTGVSYALLLPQNRVALPSARADQVIRDLDDQGIASRKETDGDPTNDRYKVVLTRGETLRFMAGLLAADARTRLTQAGLTVAVVDDPDAGMAVAIDRWPPAQQLILDRYDRLIHRVPAGVTRRLPAVLRRVVEGTGRLVNGRLPRVVYAPLESFLSAKAAEFTRTTTASTDSVRITIGTAALQRALQGDLTDLMEETGRAVLHSRVGRGESDPAGIEYFWQGLPVGEGDRSHLRGDEARRLLATAAARQDVQPARRALSTVDRTARSVRLALRLLTREDIVRRWNSTEAAYELSDQHGVPLGRIQRGGYDGTPVVTTQVDVFVDGDPGRYRRLRVPAREADVVSALRDARADAARRRHHARLLLERLPGGITSTSTSSGAPGGLTAQAWQALDAELYRTVSEASSVRHALGEILAGLEGATAQPGQDGDLLQALRAGARQFILGGRVAVVTPYKPGTSRRSREELERVLANTARQEGRSSRVPVRALLRWWENTSREAAYMPGDAGVMLVAPWAGQRLDHIVVHELAHLAQDHVVGLELSEAVKEFQAYALQRAYLQMLPLDEVPPHWRYVRDATDEQILDMIRKEPEYQAALEADGSDVGPVDTVAETRRIVEWVKKLSADQAWLEPRRASRGRGTPHQAVRPETVRVPTADGRSAAFTFRTADQRAGGRPHLAIKHLGTPEEIHEGVAQLRTAGADLSQVVRIELAAEGDLADSVRRMLVDEASGEVLVQQPQIAGLLTGLRAAGNPARGVRFSTLPAHSPAHQAFVDGWGSVVWLDLTAPIAAQAPRDEPASSPPGPDGIPQSISAAVAPANSSVEGAPDLEARVPGSVVALVRNAHGEVTTLNLLLPQGRELIVMGRGGGQTEALEFFRGRGHDPAEIQLVTVILGQQTVRDLRQAMVGAPEEGDRKHRAAHAFGRLPLVLETLEALGDAGNPFGEVGLNIYDLLRALRRVPGSSPDNHAVVRLARRHLTGVLHMPGGATGAVTLDLQPTPSTGETLGTFPTTRRADVADLTPEQSIKIYLQGFDTFDVAVDHRRRLDLQPDVPVVRLVERASSGLSQFPPYRGTSYGRMLLDLWETFQELDIGHEFIRESLTLGSASIEGARGHGYPFEFMQPVILAIEGTSGRDVSGLVGLPAGSRIIYPRRTRFVVTGLERGSGNDLRAWIMRVREVSPGEILPERRWNPGEPATPVRMWAEDAMFGAHWLAARARDASDPARVQAVTHRLMADVGALLSLGRVSLDESRELIGDAVGALFELRQEVPEYVPLAIPGGLGASEGFRVTHPDGRLLPPSHVLDTHGPSVSDDDLRAQVATGKKKVATRFGNGLVMNLALRRALQVHEPEITDWLTGDPFPGSRKSIVYDPGFGPLGTGFYRDPRTDDVLAIPPDRLRAFEAILRATGDPDNPYVIHTVFPSFDPKSTASATPQAFPEP
jgi:trehalose 6-phosphate synthase